MEQLWHLALIWLGTFLAFILANATRLTPVVYYLGVGCLFVNLGWLPTESGEFIHTLAELGIIVIMFALGFEEDTSHFLDSLKVSWGIAFFGAVAPYLCAFSLAWAFWGDLPGAILCGLAMTATAVSLTMVSLRSEELQTSEVATRTMASAVIDDIASLALVAIVVPIVAEGRALELDHIAQILGKAVLFFLLISVIGAWVFPHDHKGKLRHIPIIGRFGLKHLLMWRDGEYAVLQVLVLALVAGLVGHYFGFHPAVGGYMAGLVMKREYFHGANEQGSYLDTKRIIDNVAFYWIGPVFFINLGAHILFDWQILSSVLLETLALTLAVALSQVLSASLAARYTGGMQPAASIMVGLGMLGRAELAFVVMNIAYVQYALISTEMFYTLMGTCMLLNIAVPISIKLWRPQYEQEMSKDAAS